jgi:hypothetical protein
VVVRERGQATVEWVGLVGVVALLLLGLVVAGVRMPGAALARAVASRILCAAALADRCGDEPALIAAYGSEIGKLVRDHMPTIFFEEGSRALPVDFRSCRETACGDGSRRGLVYETDVGLPVTAFVHAIERAGNVYIQYWLYYADSATLRGVPIAGTKGYHEDDWESVQIRIGPDGSVDERASSHHGYNHTQGLSNAGSDLGSGPLTAAAEAVSARPHDGWGPETGVLLVSGGSHAGNANGFPRFDRVTPAGRVHLVPLEPIAAEEGDAYRFAISPPWEKSVWRNPEATSTD